MTNATKSANKAPAKKTAKKTAKKSGGGDNCWPGFEHTPGTTPGEKGSCRPEPGARSKATKKATQKTAAAAKLQKAGKPKPKTK